MLSHCHFHTSGLNRDGSLTRDSPAKVWPLVPWGTETGSRIKQDSTTGPTTGGDARALFPFCIASIRCCARTTISIPSFCSFETEMYFVAIDGQYNTFILVGQVPGFNAFQEHYGREPALSSKTFCCSLFHFFLRHGRLPQPRLFQKCLTARVTEGQLHIFTAPVRGHKKDAYRL